MSQEYLGGFGRGLEGGYGELSGPSTSSFSNCFNAPFLKTDFSLLLGVHGEKMNTLQYQVQEK